jgi:hypothetical protein
MIKLRELEKNLSGISAQYGGEFVKEFCPTAKDRTEVTYFIDDLLSISTIDALGVDCNNNATPEDASCSYLKIGSKPFPAPGKLRTLADKTADRFGIKTSEMGKYCQYIQIVDSIEKIIEVGGKLNHAYRLFDKEKRVLC